MPLHHIIPKHEFLERFGNLIGVNHPDNIVNLTLPQHAEVHLLLYELNQNENDLIAHQAVVGMIQKKSCVKKVRKPLKKKRKTKNQYRKYSL